MRAPLIALALALSAPAARACDTALVLAMDVSNSVDVGEYRIQADGLAAALEDPEIADAMIAGQVAVTVVQWSGADRQVIALPWMQIFGPDDVTALAAAARAMPRAFVLSDTAPGDAVRFAAAQFATGPVCAHNVIDVSGDGTPNAGVDIRLARSEAQAAGITINGLAIESLGRAITNFYERDVVTRDGFVVTARGHEDFARAIRAKILAELSKGLV
ncbi:MAG: DUF1194 domain-containing protein [Limimaricola sp.]|uniref:DUF1194 domain-containing protein n=1 Tax=Limimaricola sp. TaxID=2211665 RepID=UPI001D6121C4|nr:DUF1194 domain-containing protein [Limimaricola sp.]MBI1416872.1 DUF1194 domain-containing protein [Limimaricola sp.]